MSNVFIKEITKFYNYITTTHCKDFKDEYLELNNILFNELFAERLGVTLYNKRKRKIKAIKSLYNVLPNKEYITIKNYIFKDSSEENKFNDWVSVIKNFIDFVINFSDPALLSPLCNTCKFKIEHDKNIKFEFENDTFIFCINFEKTKIKKNNSSLFDTITGLDKENTFSFIKIEVTNKASNNTYNYKYMEDSSLINLEDLDDFICDAQLEYIKSQLDEFIYKYIEKIFDLIVSRELNMDFMFYSYTYKDKEIKEQWMNHGITGLSTVEDK